MKRFFIIAALAVAALTASAQDNYKFTIKAGLAFERNHLAVGFEYSRGLYKLYPDLSQYNQSFGITLGFRI